MFTAKNIKRTIGDEDGISIESKSLFLAKAVNKMDEHFASSIRDEDGTKIGRDTIIKKIIALEAGCEGVKTTIKPPRARKSAKSKK